MWYRRTIPLVIVFLMGVLGFSIEFIPHRFAAELRDYYIATGMIIIGAFGMFIGTYSLLHMHFTRIRQRQAGWGYSIFVFLGATVTIAAGLYNGGYGPMGAAPDEHTFFDWIFNNVLMPCDATIFSILAFFIASAAYRAFRAKNLEAIMLLAAALLVMFGRVPISEQISMVFPKIVDFLMENPNMAAKRAILFGITLGMVSQSLRVLFGIERSYMGAGD